MTKDYVDVLLEDYLGDDTPEVEENDPFDEYEKDE